MTDAAAPAAAPAPAALPPPAPKPPVATWKLIAVLAGGGAVAGLLLVVAYLKTIEPIRAHKALVLAEGVREVLGLRGEDRYDELWVVGDHLAKGAPAGQEGGDRAWLGRRADGTPVGWALVASGNGFADEIRVLFGYDAKTKKVLALKVLDNKETPGLGDGIAKTDVGGGKPTFSQGFAGKVAPVKGVKPDSTPNGPNEVDTISGATVSSRAVIRILDKAVERWAPLLEAYREEGPR